MGNFRETECCDGEGLSALAKRVCLVGWCVVELGWRRREVMRRDEWRMNGGWMASGMVVIFEWISEGG